MRLLSFKDGQLDLTKDHYRDIPSYAILSHTWGDDEDELSFKDVTDGTGKNKVGFRKIQFCGRQAARDGLNISGWTLVASTKRTAQSLQKLSTPCTAGIKGQTGATCTCRTFRQRGNRPLGGSRIFRKVDGSNGAGLFRS